MFATLASQTVLAEKLKEFNVRCSERGDQSSFTQSRHQRRRGLHKVRRESQNKATECQQPGGPPSAQLRQPKQAKHTVDLLGLNPMPASNTKRTHGNASLSTELPAFTRNKLCPRSLSSNDHFMQSVTGDRLLSPRSPLFTGKVEAWCALSTSVAEKQSDRRGPELGA